MKILMIVEESFEMIVVLLHEVVTHIMGLFEIVANSHLVGNVAIAIARDDVVMNVVEMFVLVIMDVAVTIETASIVV